MKPAVLSLVTSINERYTCKQFDSVPKPLPDSLFKEDRIQLDYIDMPQQCQQASSHRVKFGSKNGCITVYNLKSACKTNTAKPVRSLVKSICYPEARKFSTVAVR